MTFRVHNDRVSVWQRSRHFFKETGYIRSNSPELSRRLLLINVVCRSPDLLKNISIYATFQIFFQIPRVLDKKLYGIRNYLAIFIIYFNRGPNVPRTFLTLYHQQKPSKEHVDTYHIETSPLICRANQWTDFYMLGTSVLLIK